MSPDDHAFSPGTRARNIDSGARVVPSVCPHDCTSTCALDVERLDARTIGRIRGSQRNDYTAGVICEKVARYAERIHHPDRLMKPLRRTGPKGSKQFAEISWSDALDIVAEQFIAKAALHGTETVWPYYYAGTMGLVQRDGINRLRNAMKYSRYFSTICVTLSDTGWIVGSQTTLLHIVAPALLCAITSVFAIWQIALTAVAARRRGGGVVPLLAVVAAAASVLAIGTLLYDRAVPALAELWNIYGGDEELGDLNLPVSADGTILYVDGSYGMGSEQAVRRMLEQNPKVREVVLSGPGGRMGAGFEISRMIRSRRLATRVETGCASACTIAFLGGVDRSIAPGAKLGFHQASFPGMSADDMFEANRDMKRFLTMSAGIAPDFAQRVLDTPGDSIWVPTPEELLAARVIKRLNR